MVHPMTNVRNQVLGATFVTWDGRELLSTGKPLRIMMNDTLRVGAQNGSFLNQRAKGVTRGQGTPLRLRWAKSRLGWPRRCRLRM